MQAFEQLREALSEAKSLVEQAATERNKAAQVASLLKNLRIGFDDYGNRRVVENLVPWAARINDSIKKEVAAEVEAMNAADLRQRSLRLEELRAVIPQLAAKAAIELGCQAREFEAQATQDPNP